METLYFDLDKAKKVLPAKEISGRHYLLNTTGRIIGMTSRDENVLGKCFFDLNHVEVHERAAIMQFLTHGSASAMLAMSTETPFLFFRTLFGMTGAYLVALPPKELCAVLSGPSWYALGEQNGIVLSPTLREAGMCLDGS